MCDALTVWAKIAPLLNTTKTNDIEIYKGKIDNFKKNLNLFHKVGGRSFLKMDRANIEGKTLFYMRCSNVLFFAKLRCALKTTSNTSVNIYNA